ncbi:AB hydrolase superfamily protein [Colletotrichum tropicale]|nr:AB hydrolase superfamily protein [Colletotrichum tropicale]
MSDQVGFGFQVDVVNTASLSHMLTGRVLKALSDGGVDTYALAAAFWLGAKVPVRTSLSDMVHFHISQRKNYQSVLSKALSIGWGHSTPVVEMTRTRAGSNALLVIGAFSTGCLPFQAAQCFSEFLTLSGLGPEMLPSTDVLKGLVTYLGPFVHDLGFSKVVQHVNDLAERAVRATVTARFGDLIDMKKRELDYLGRLSNLGTAPAVAAAIKQLMFSSRKGQKDYMILSIRGSWLVAFTSHILGMSVNLRFNNRTVWASGGDHGDITFQLGARFEDTFSIQPSSEPLRVTAAADARRQYESQIAVEYFIEEALEAQSVRLPQLDPAIMESVHGAIRRFSFHILQILTSMDYLWESEAGDNPQGFFPFQMKFDSSAALNLILDTMRVGPTTERAPRSLYFDPYAQDSETLKTDKNRYIYALSYMDSDSVQKVAARCQTHRQFASSLVELDRELFSVTGSAEAGCICRTVEKIVQGFAVSAVGLMQCKFEDFELRVQQSTIVGEIETDWSRKCVLLVNNPDKIDHIPTHHDFFDHLGQLVFPDYSRTWLRSRPMYASKRSYDMESFIKSRETRPQLIQTLLAALPPLDPSLEEFRDVATLPDGYKIDLQIVRHRDVNETNGGKPLILLWPGGGFIVAGVEPTTRPAREFALEFDAVVVNATYRLAPEHKFPQAVMDGWETAKWLAKNASRYGADITKGFVIGGWSAGGNISAVVAQRSGVEGLGITGVMLGIPLIFSKDIVPEKYASEWTSREDNATWSETFTTEVIESVKHAYDADVRSKWYSPINDPEAIPRSPKAYIHVGDRDPLRDDGLIYAKVLQDNGVEVRVDNYLDWGHQGWTIFAPKEVPADLASNTMKGMKWLLGRE